MILVARIVHLLPYLKLSMSSPSSELIFHLKRLESKFGFGFQNYRYCTSNLDSTTLFESYYDLYLRSPYVLRSNSLVVSQIELSVYRMILESNIN